MSCPFFFQIRALPVDWLFGIATNLLDRSDLRTFLNTSRRVPTKKKVEILAELVYYEIGSTFMAQEQWKQMTRLQLQYELRLKGLLGDGEELSDSQLRLRLASAVLRERQQIEQKLEEKLSVEVDEEDEEDCEASDDRETEGDNDDDGSPKIIYTKNNGRTMVF